MHLLLHLMMAVLMATCHTTQNTQPLTTQISNDTTALPIVTGAERLAVYFPQIERKNIALVVNQTSTVGQKHLVDTLIKLGANIKIVFAPEHGFRGKADAGELISDTKDNKTGLPIISLYGKKKKPSADDMKGIDAVIFDIQDVGVRFYTYISTLHYIMESCAENKVPLIVLDRPNPNAYFVDGPILKPEFKSFVGMHPVPVVYGMTIGEYAKMINGEGWLAGQTKCDLTVVACKNYTHQTYYELPIKPSPNLADMRSILLYPSTCFFEGTTLSLGRGTDKPFQYIGHPKLKSEFSFTPMPNEGAKEPPLKGQLCFGTDLSKTTTGSIIKAGQINLNYLLQYYNEMKNINEKFFLENLFIDKLAGNDQLRLQLEKGMTEAQIRATWQNDLAQFMKLRSKYLLY